MKFSVNSRLLYTVFSAIVILIGSLVAIKFAQGYRVSRKGVVQGNGLLSVNSFPSGAEVYINDKLVTATDDTIYLEPGKYNVQIRKDGYIDWQKNLQVDAELVTQTNAQLFRRVPTLSPLTFAGVKNIYPSPDGQKLLFYTASASAELKNGLYILELSNGLLTNQKEPRQIAEPTAGFDLERSHYIWSPDNTEIMLLTPQKEILLDITKKNNLTTLPDISFRRKQLLSEWESQLYQKERQFFDKFPDEIIQMATTSARNAYLSPDKKKLLYTYSGTTDLALPDNMTAPVLAANSQPEERTLKAGSTYIYDKEEDRNFKLEVAAISSTSAQLAGLPVTPHILLATDLWRKEPLTLAASPSSFTRLQTTPGVATSSAELTPTPSPASRDKKVVKTATPAATNNVAGEPIPVTEPAATQPIDQIARNFANYYSSLYSTGYQWFPDSKHVVWYDKDRIYLTEYDNTNKTSIFAGQFLNDFVYPWPDGSKILILTSFSQNLPPNLYGIEVK